jgi:hypothetical protein
VATVPNEMQGIGTEAGVSFDPQRMLVYHNDVLVEGLAA